MAYHQLLFASIPPLALPELPSPPRKVSDRILLKPFTDVRRKGILKAPCDFMTAYSWPRMQYIHNKHITASHTSTL